MLLQRINSIYTYLSGFKSSPATKNIYFSHSFFYACISQQFILNLEVRDSTYYVALPCECVAFPLQPVKVTNYPLHLNYSGHCNGCPFASVPNYIDIESWSGSTLPLLSYFILTVKQILGSLSRRMNTLNKYYALIIISCKLLFTSLPPSHGGAPAQCDRNHKHTSGRNTNRRFLLCGRPRSG